MSGFDKLKTAVIVLIVGGMGAGVLWQYLRGTVDLHLVVDEGRQVRLSIDGQPIAPAIRRGQHLRFDVAQGTHEVKLEDAEGGGKARTFSLKVSSGFDNYVLPFSEEQCFTRFDVSKTMYERRSSGESIPPTISGKYQAQEPFELPSSSYFSVDELPQTLKKSGSAHLLLPTPCPLLKLEDRQLIQLAGFEVP